MDWASVITAMTSSLSARRAWIEIFGGACARRLALVALRKESVDRNVNSYRSTRRKVIVALRKESVDRNLNMSSKILILPGRSPQGERG